MLLLQCTYTYSQWYNVTFSCEPGTEMHGQKVLFLLFTLVPVVSAVRDRWRNFPEETLLEIQDTPNTVVNVTVPEFQNISKSNRDAYNSVFHLLKVNHTLAPVNILLHGLNGTVPNGTEAQSGPEDADAGADVPGKHTFGGGVLPDDWVEILRGKKSREKRLYSHTTIP
jgi:hypothetical protein